MRGLRGSGKDWRREGGAAQIRAGSPSAIAAISSPDPSRLIIAPLPRLPFDENAKSSAAGRHLILGGDVARPCATPASVLWSAPAQGDCP